MNKDYIENVKFVDAVAWNGQAKTAVSVRDGFLEYSGQELGIEPAARIFRVYRSPATIANVANAMVGIPLTDEHVELDRPVDRPVGAVTSAEMVDLYDENTDSKLAIRNGVEISDMAQASLDNGKRELSLGYNANLVPFEGETYDFEQRDIQPHHLAVVQNGRCGSACSFMDKKTTTDSSVLTNQKVINMQLHKAFCDEDGAANLDMIVEIMAALPEAIKTVPLEKVMEVIPQLQELLATAKTVVPESEDEVEAEMVEEVEAEVEDTEVEAEDEDMTEQEEEQTKFSDTSEFKDAVQAAKDEAVAAHTSVLVKAADFLDAEYDYSGKSTNDIMRDALATQSTDDFADAELNVAFKLLKKQADYSQFGDSQDSLEKLKNKEL